MVSQLLTLTVQPRQRRAPANVLTFYVHIYSKARRLASPQLRRMISPMNGIFYDGVYLCCVLLQLINSTAAMIIVV